MSRLIHDPKQQRKTEVPDLVIDDAVILRLLKSCQSLAMDQGRPAFQQFLKAFDAALDSSIDLAHSNQERGQLVQLQKQLRLKRDDLERYFCGYLAEGFVKFKKRQLNTAIAQDIGTASELELLDNEQLEESIAISSVCQRANAYYAEPLWALNRRLSVLNQGDKVAEENNPVAPIQLCDSLRRTLKLVPMDGGCKLLAYRVFDECMFKYMGALILDTNDFLRGQGVLPHLSVVAPSGAIPQSYLAETGRQASAAELQAPAENLPPERDMVKAIRDLQALLNDAAPASGRSASSGVDAAGLQQVLTMLASLPAQTPADTDEQRLAPADIRAVAEALAGQLAKPDSTPANRNEMQTIDLVGMLFEYMLNDENLPDAVKALLSYLHTPFLKLAFVDPGFFEQSQHPARVLLNNLAEAGARWVRDDGSSEFGIYGKIKEVVDHVLSDFDNDVRVITELLFEFSSYTKGIVRRQELMEKRAKEKAQGEERLRSVKVRVNEAIRERTDGHELPSAILLLLLQPWSDFLSFALLRYGEDSDQWHESLAVVDDILWCIEPKHSSQERSRQQELHGSVLQALESGLATIGYDQSKTQQLIESVDVLIRQVMQCKKVEPAPAPMRDQLERQAAEKAGGNTANSQEELSPEEEQMVDNLKMVEFGTWLEFTDGKRLKVAWYNNRTSHYMLVDQMGKRAAMMSGVAIARAMIAKEARMISGSSKPFFDRALENIFQKLNAQAEALAGEAQTDVT